MSYGSGKYTYELVDWHASFPEGWQTAEVNCICIDAQDRLYAFNDGEYPVTVFDRNGSLLSVWGKEYVKHSHGASVGPDGNVYYADDGNHTVCKFSPEGKLLLQLGTRDTPATDSGWTNIGPDGKRLNPFEAIKTTKRGGSPFNQPTDVAVTPTGDMYVADGYGNARIHKFSPEGKLLFSWGEPGSGPGQFLAPHGVALDKNGRVYVADRHNNRVQIFDAFGKYITEWKDINLPTHVVVDKDQTVYVSELIPPGVSIFDLDGKRLARWDNTGTTKENPLMVVLHSLAVDSRGDLYVADIMPMEAGTPFFFTRKTRMIQKFVRK